MPGSKPTTVTEYIEAAPQEAQEKLHEIRAILKKVSPNATETLKWGSPVFEEGRILFSYSAHKSHLNFSPTGPAMEPFKEELEKYKTGKDTIQFPYDQPLPTALIRKIAASKSGKTMRAGCIERIAVEGRESRNLAAVIGVDPARRSFMKSGSTL